MNKTTANPFALAEINAFLSDVQGKGNTSQFFLQLGQQRITDNLVMSVRTSSEEPISLHSDFKLSVTLLPKSPLIATELIGCSATFCRLDGGRMTPLHAVVIDIAASKEVVDEGAVDVLLASPLHLLKHQRHNRVYVDRHTSEVIKDILQAALGHWCDVEIVTKKHRSAKEMLTQYQETDYDFIQRVLAQEGLFVFCAQGEERTALKIISDLNELPARDRMVVELPYMQNSGTAKDKNHVSLVQSCHGLAPSRFHLKNYDPDTGFDLKVHSKAPTGGQAGTTEIWGLNYSTPEEGEQLATQIAASHLWRNRLLRIITNAPGLLPGHQLDLTGNTPHAGSYRVISLNFQGDQSSLSNSGGTGKEFFCEAYVLPLEIDYRPQLQPRTPLPLALSARITQEVDEQGCYRLQYPFDQENQKETASSRPVRQLQAFGGPDHGMHFPLAEETEVVVSGLNGDLDRPVILGSLFSEKAPDIVSRDTARTNLIQTRGGHTLCMEDQPEKEHLLLATPESKNRLLLDATQNYHRIELVSEEGDLELAAGLNLNFSSGSSQFVEVGEDQHVEIGGDDTLLTEEGGIQISAGTDFLLEAQDNIHWRTEQGSIELVSAEDMTCSSEGERFDEIKEGNFTVDVTEGHCLIQSADDLAISSLEGHLTLENAGGLIQVSSDGNLLLEGAEIELTADSILASSGDLTNN